MNYHFPSEPKIWKMPSMITVFIIYDWFTFREGTIYVGQAQNLMTRFLLLKKKWHGFCRVNYYNVFWRLYYLSWLGFDLLTWPCLITCYYSTINIAQSQPCLSQLHLQNKSHSLLLLFAFCFAIVTKQFLLSSHKQALSTMKVRTRLIFSSPSPKQCMNHILEFSELCINCFLSCFRCRSN